MKEEAEWIMKLDEVYLLNGLIRKYKPINCLEIGIAKGGSSILILNAIKDYNNSRLVSIDLFAWIKNKKRGYLVEEKFPELMKKWDFFLGDMPHKFLSKLNRKYDFVFLDSAHMSPGEFFDFIEILPFLKDNAIIVLHDITWHYYMALKTEQTLYDAKIMPTNIYLMSVLMGKKILLQEKFNYFKNIGVVCLYKNQKKYYLIKII